MTAGHEEGNILQQLRPFIRMTAVLLAVAAAAAFTGCRSGRTPSDGGSDASSAVSTGDLPTIDGTGSTDGGESEKTTMNEQTAADRTTTGGRQTAGSAGTGGTAATTAARTTGSTTDDTPKSDDSYAFDGDPNTLWTAPSFGTTVLTYRPKQAVTFNTVRFKERGDRIDEIAVEIPDGKGGYLPVYRQDEVGVRLGVLDRAVTAAEVRVAVTSAQRPVIEDITFENVQPFVRKEKFRIVSYLTANMTDARANFDKLDIMTDLILFGRTSWTQSGELDFGTEGVARFERDLAEIREAIGSRQIDLWLCIGNFAAGSDRGKLLADPADRKRLVDNCVSAAKRYDLVGIDVDYEYPADATAWDNYALFLEELGPALKKEGKLLSVALSPWGVRLSKAAIRSIDRVNIMSYTLNDRKKRRHAFKITRTSIEYFTYLGFAPSQLVLGLAFYAMSVTQPDASYSGHPYHTYVQRYRTGIKTYTNQIEDLYYGGRDLNRDKTILAIENDLAGAFSWHFGCDIAYSDERSLFRAVKETADRFTAIK